MMWSDATCRDEYGQRIEVDSGNKLNDNTDHEAVGGCKSGLGDAGTNTVRWKRQRVEVVNEGGGMGTQEGRESMG